MTHSKHFGAAIIGILVFLVVIATYFSAQTAKANPPQFSASSKSSAATTTPTYIAPGTSIATTSLIYDSAEVNGTNQTNNSNTFIPDSVTLLVQYAASSSVSVLNICAEYSMDLQDWYRDNLASSTPNGNISANNCLQWTFASSSIHGLGGAVTAATGATSTKAITFPVPTRYIRWALFITGTNGGGAVYLSAIPKKQTR